MTKTSPRTNGRRASAFATKLSRPGPKVHPGRSRVDRRDGDGVGVGAVDALNVDPVADADAGVPADDRLDADQSLPFVIRLGATHDRRGRLASPDLDHVPEPDLEALSGLHVQPGGA